MSESSVAIDGTHIAAASLDGVGMIDGTEYIYATDTLADIHGYETSQELVGHRWEELYSPLDPALTARDLLSQTRDTGQWQGRATGQTQHGDSVPVELSLRRTESGVVCVARDITEPKERERELERYETILETVDDGVYVLDENFCFSFVNKGLCEMTEKSREELLGMPVIELFEYDDETRAVEKIRQRVIESDTSIGTIQGTLPTAEGQRILEARFRLYPEPDDTYWGSIGVVRDVTDRQEREQQLERQRDELDTLNRINELLLAVARDLFESSMHGDIEQTVCTRLAESDLYQFAWIGKPEGGSDRLVPDASAGIDDEFIASMTVTTDEAATGQGPGGRAFRTGTIQVSQDIETDPTFEPWREAALDHDVRSAAAVPLIYDGTTYGILAVYASRPLAFSRREQRGFEILGEAIGYAINATRTRRLLFAEEIVELELCLTDQSGFAIEAADRLGCHLSLEGYVSTDDDSWLLYFSLSGAAGDRFVDVAGKGIAVETVRLIGEGTAQVVAFTMQSSLLDSIAALGGKITSGDIDDGRGTFVVEIPQSTAVREFIEQVRSTYPGVELLAKRDDERPAEQSMWLSENGDVDLTDRQRQALEAAYHAGYFQWPRESSAEEVADLLDVSRPTLQAHIRKAEHELLDTFLDGAE